MPEYRPYECGMCGRPQTRSKEGVWEYHSMDLGNGPVEVCRPCKRRYGARMDRVLGRTPAAAAGPGQPAPAWVRTSRRRPHVGPTLEAFS